MMRIITQVNDELTSRGLQCDEIFMFDRKSSAIGQMNPEWTEWLGVQSLANLINLHETTHT